MELQRSRAEILAENSILLRGTPETCFTFKIDMDISTIEELNMLKQLIEHVHPISEILNNKAKINFHFIENKIFKNNMILVDSYLCNIIAEMLIIYCLNENDTIAELINVVAKKNPLEYNATYAQRLYKYKVRNFLYHLVMGMNATEIWNGEYNSLKQFLIEANNNELVKYNIYNRNQFEDYLFHNTRLETASSTRHKFGTIYKDPSDNCFYMKLNLQIRFTSKKKEQ